MKRTPTAKQLEALRRGRPRKGEVRNPKGINGWTKARERVRDAVAAHADDLVEAMVHLAKEGDIQALKYLLSPLMPQPAAAKAEEPTEIRVRWMREGEQTPTGQ